MATANGSSSAPMGATKDIFDGVYFAVVPSEGLSKLQADKITSDLTSNGATHCPLSSSSELNRVTHLISVTSDFPAYHDAIDGFIHVVKPSWVEHSIIKRKAANPRTHSPDPEYFLADVVVTCADDIPVGDNDAIVAGVLAMGGQYSRVLTKLVTHVVALTMDNPQCQIIMERNLNCKPVLPHWFDACLVLGKKIDTAPYLLPNPPVFTKRTTAPLGDGLPPSIEAYTTDGELRVTHIATPPSSPSQERKELAVFVKKNVMLHEDLKLTERLRTTITDIIRQYGGTLVDHVDSADMLICRLRDSDEFKAAARASLSVGNLNWLYYLINHNRWTDPLRRLLHYPFPKGGIKGFENCSISLSNYTGEARVYLETLVKAAGGECSKTLSQDNTHLITAHLLSEKCVAAAEWNINIVNHLWLEESYAKCKVQSITNKRYTTFPEHTNLGDVLGQTYIDRSAIRRHHFPSASQVQEDKEDSIIEDTALHGTAVSSRTTAGEQVKSGVKRRAIDTPLPTRTAAETPSSRSAKDRALTKLHSMASDIALFAKESKRKGGVVYGGRRVTDPDRIEISNGASGRKGDQDEVEDDDMSSKEVNTPAPEPPRKKQKQSKAGIHKPKVTAVSTEPELKVLITGYDQERNKATSSLKPKLRPLNITIVERVDADIDIIAAPRFLRTRKFPVGIAAAADFVSVSWLESMCSKKERLPFDQYVLKDAETEGKLGFRLADVLERARKHKAEGGMLKGWTIFCSEGSTAGFDICQEIVKANGGACLLFKGRETTVRHRITEEAGADGEQVEELYLITDAKDKKVWPKFKAMATEQGFTPKLVFAEWLYRMAQSQDREYWDPSFECVEDTK